MSVWFSVFRRRELFDCEVSLFVCERSPGYSIKSNTLTDLFCPRPASPVPSGGSPPPENDSSGPDPLHTRSSPAWVAVPGSTPTCTGQTPRSPPVRADLTLLGPSSVQSPSGSGPRHPDTSGPPRSPERRIVIPSGQFLLGCHGSLFLSDTCFDGEENVNWGTNWVASCPSFGRGLHGPVVRDREQSQG